MNDEIAAIRAYTIPKQEPDTKQPKFFHKTIQNFIRMMILDCEATTDFYHNLKFGYFKVIFHGKLDYHGIFYDPLFVKGKEFNVLKQFSDENKIKIYTLEQFRKIFLKETFDLQTLCIGFNLPFDLSRIAIKSSNSKFKRKGGFSLLFSKNLDYPRLHVTHATSTLSFIEFGSTMGKQNKFRGNFLDLRTLCYALTDKKHSLKSAGKYFKTRYKKQTGIEHGKITSQYIQYCINDVNTTYAIYQKAKKEFDSYGLKIPVTRAYTPASIGKEFLKMIGVDSFLDKNPEFPKKIIGYMMCGYIGGRVEDKIRKTPVLVDVLDFLSMYPTVCTLQNLWRFVIADHVEYLEATREIADFIDKFTLEDVQNPQNWTRLQGIVLIEPHEDVLPLRAKYGQKHVWNIGISHVTSKIPLWYSLADVIASKLYTGRTPKILKAYRFVPVGVQKNLKKINVQGIEIDPYKDDLFKKLIEYRQVLKNKYDPRQKIIKIITNAISYGIFVEINTLEESSKVPIDVYGMKHFTQDKTKIEKPGFMFNPIIAVSITSASRLLLATCEILLSRKNMVHAYCDTDSMMVPPEMTREIQEFFQPLNPYNFDADILKVERENVMFYGISSKRYCLHTIKNGKITIKNDDYSSHGLGHLLDPFSNNPDEKNDWNKYIWNDIMDLHYEKSSLEELYSKYDNKYAMSQFMASSPRMLARLSNFNKNDRYQDQFKPFSFCIVGFSNLINPNTGELVKPLAPFVKPARHAVFGDFVDYNDNSMEKLRGKQYWKPFWQIFMEYLNHPESKIDGDVGILERKHVNVTGIIHIGKESNELEESELLGVGSGSYETYEDVRNLDKKFKKIAPSILKLKPKDVKKIRISKQTLWNVKKKIYTNQVNHISMKIKVQLVRCYEIQHN
ncbi:DNA-directed DNA polymerase B [Nitrosotalea sinensis]|uniref:DNA-directed DNA polymerase B n=1 Tax=Nitrosotalea sinensis TaxID=1499975 RepID=A0A2H1EII7_9ARCH|nr:hypothetical protein [Candidatus Nitrosotalea sinensis]SHO47632.1 DNA-directed DNA polymerase B [Candidatus Nitrosotalea sinensis]